MQGKPQVRPNQKSLILLYPTEYSYNNPINSFKRLHQHKLPQQRTPLAAKNLIRPIVTKRANLRSCKVIKMLAKLRGFLRRITTIQIW